MMLLPRAFRLLLRVRLYSGLRVSAIGSTLPDCISVNGLVAPVVLVRTKV